MELFLSLITGISIGAAAGYLGSLMLSKRMALVGGPLGHLALPGIALGLIYHFDIFLGALASIILGVLFIWFFEIKTRLPLEVLTGVVFSLGVALGFLILPIENAEEAIIGDITAVGLSDAILALVLAVGVFLTIRKIYQKIILSSISEDLAKGKKINIRKMNFIYLLAIALITALEVKLVGIILTAALFAIPAAAARNLSRDLFQYQTLSTLIGSLSVVFGILLFEITSLSAGPLIILSAGFFFALSLLSKNIKT